MRPLWLELMLTPMAAPETRRLRVMRRTIVAGALLVALGSASARTVARLGGRPGVAILAALCVALAVLATVYATAKLRADAAHLAAPPKDDR